MSRSIKQEYDKLRKLQSEGKVFTVHKWSVPVSISDEQLYVLLAIDNPEYKRKATKTVVASTNEDWAKYHLAKRALLTLRAYENTTGTEEVEIPSPKPRTEYTFLETHDEWIERCHQMRQAERKAA